MLRSMNVKSLNPHITCVLCGGYLVDATTIIECLHSFCRSCIIRWLDRSYKCPVCETEIHKTRPYLNIRPDRVLQDIVYKLVPGLYDNELSRRKEFDTGAESNQNDKNRDKNKKDEIEDPVCVTLEYYGVKRFWQQKTVFPTRYLRCSSQLPVNVLKKFVSMKFGLPNTHLVEIVRSDEILSDHLTLRELWRVYGLHNKAFIDLQYIIIDKKLDKAIAHQEPEKPKFKKIVKKRRRKRKSSLTENTESTGLTPTKRKKRKRAPIVGKRPKTDLTQEKTGDDVITTGEHARLDKATIQTVDQLVNKEIFLEQKTITTQLTNNTQISEKLNEPDVKYACPVTPESEADHNDFLTPSLEEKPADILPSAILD